MTPHHSCWSGPQPVSDPSIWYCHHFTATTWCKSPTSSLGLLQSFPFGLLASSLSPTPSHHSVLHITRVTRVICSNGSWTMCPLLRALQFYGLLTRHFPLLRLCTCCSLCLERSSPDSDIHVACSHTFSTPWFIYHLSEAYPDHHILPLNVPCFLCLFSLEFWSSSDKQVKCSILFLFLPENVNSLGQSFCPLCSLLLWESRMVLGIIGVHIFIQLTGRFGA